MGQKRARSGNESKPVLRAAPETGTVNRPSAAGSSRPETENRNEVDRARMREVVNSPASLPELRNSGSRAFRESSIQQVASRARTKSRIQARLKPPIPTAPMRRLRSKRQVI
jgi:hypothetical protein